MSSEACRYTPWGREKLEPVEDCPTFVRIPQDALPIIRSLADHEGVSSGVLIMKLACERAVALGFGVPAAQLGRRDVEDARALTLRHGNSRAHSCRGGDHG